MRVVIVTGIYPPDIGGPATHAADLREELVRRGHQLAVLTLWNRGGVERRDGIVRWPRSWPWPIRLACVGAWLAIHGSRYDFVYATGLEPAAIAGARAARRPVIVKVVGDSAWERGRRRGLTHDDFEPFQRRRGGTPSVRAMRWIRNRSLRAASAITAPSDYLARTIDGWLAGPAGVHVIPNGVRAQVAASRHVRSGDLRVIYVGRLVAHKRVDAIVRAVADVDRTHLTVVGGGPERPALEAEAAGLAVGDRVLFAGELANEEVRRRIGASDVLVLASDYEGLPHVVIEALVSGTPVVSVPVGGVGEVVRDGENGLIVEAPAAIGSALGALRDDEDLLRRLSEGAMRDGERWSIGAMADRVESLAEDVRRRRPRIAFIGKSLFPKDPGAGTSRKLVSLQRSARPVLVNIGTPCIRHVGRTRVVVLPALRPPMLGGIVFYSIAPFIAVATTAGRRHAAVMSQSPYEGAGVSLLVRMLPRRLRPRTIVEIHGDWRTASRLYGHPARRVVADLSDRIAAWSIQRADLIRVVSDYTEDLVRKVRPDAPIERFVAFSDFEAFLDRPIVRPPDEPRVLFVGSLEASKGVDVLLAAWSRVADRRPDASLTIIGAGSMEGAIRREIRLRELADRVALLGSTPHDRVLEEMDASRFLVLPSRSEGLGRVILEAFARGRAVVASDVGGVAQLVRDGETGRLVSAQDDGALADAILEGLSNPEAFYSMSRRARAAAIEFDPRTDFELGIQRVARWVAAS